MTKKKKIILIVVIAVIAAAVIVTAVLWRKSRGGAGGGNAAYVESVAELTGAQNAGVQNRYSGVVESQETWDVNVNAEQSVKEVFVQVGDTVEEGTPLFEYDTEELKLQLSQAKLEQEEIGNEISGYNSQIKTLNAEKAAASKDEQFNYTTQIQSLQTSIKQAEYNRESKKIEIQKLQDSIEQAVVTSKIAGVVKAVNESGSTDEYGNAQAFMSILSTGDYRVKGLINETNVWMISEGQQVILRSRIDEEQTWTGTIAAIDTGNEETDNTNNMYYDGSGDSEMQSSKYPFYIQLDSSEGLMLGQHVYIETDEGQTEAKEGIWLYAGYVVQDEDTPYIWADNGSGKLEKRMVELGEYDEEQDMYQIVSGISAEDYISWPQEGLSEGMKTTTDMEDSILTDDSSEDGMLDDGMLEDGTMDDGTMDDGMMEDGMPDEEGVVPEDTADDGSVPVEGADSEGSDSTPADASGEAVPME